MASTLATSVTLRDNDDAEAAGSNDDARELKKRRTHRSCDQCRRKKVRCDGSQQNDERCSTCVVHNAICTYMNAYKKHGPLETYVQYLENRVEKLEQLLRRLSPDADLLKELNGWSNFDQNSDVDSRPNTNMDSPTYQLQGTTTLSTSRPAGDLTTSKQELEDETKKLASLSIDRYGHRFFGKSGTPLFTQTAIEAKSEYAGKGHSGTESVMLGTKRRPYWDRKTWELPNVIPQLPKYRFPPDDLLPSLIDLYFEEVNLVVPLLHRPAFQRSVAQGLHHTDLWFGAVLLLVCAIGSRYSDDRRVLLDGENDLHSSGWKWFEQVQLPGMSILAPPRLYNLQIHCLSVQYLQTTSSNKEAWIMLAAAIRVAQHAGAHLKQNINPDVWTLDNELEKRAFWMLFIMDINLSAALGRPRAMEPEDFDLDYALEIDDNGPKESVKQPSKKPSRIAAFNLQAKLSQLQATALRKLYSTDKAKAVLGLVGPESQQRAVAELDSALNAWVDSVPEYLRWDPNRENVYHFKQSAVLYTNYYHSQIMIHRPFIPSPRKPSSHSFPSLAICTNAARSCINIVEVMRRRQLDAAAFVQLPVFVSGIILLLNGWGGKQSGGVSSDMQRTMTDVHKAMSALRAYEKSWPSAGRLWDVLHDLASSRDLPPPPESPAITNKRLRHEDSPGPSSLGTVVDASSEGSRGSNKYVSRAISQPNLRAVAHPSRLYKQQQQHLQQSSKLVEVYQQPPSLYRQPDQQFRGGHQVQLHHVQQQQQQRQRQQHQGLTRQQRYEHPIYDSDELGRSPPLHGQIPISNTIADSYQTQDQQAMGIWSLDGGASDNASANMSIRRHSSHQQLRPSQLQSPSLVSEFTTASLWNQAVQQQQQQQQQEQQQQRLFELWAVAAAPHHPSSVQASYPNWNMGMVDDVGNTNADGLHYIPVGAPINSPVDLPQQQYQLQEQQQYQPQHQQQLGHQTIFDSDIFQMC